MAKLCQNKRNKMNCNDKDLKEVYLRSNTGHRKELNSPQVAKFEDSKTILMCAECRRMNMGRVKIKG